MPTLGPGSGGSGPSTTTQSTTRNEDWETSSSPPLPLRNRTGPGEHLGKEGSCSRSVTRGATREGKKWTVSTFLLRLKNFLCQKRPVKTWVPPIPMGMTPFGVY